MTEKKKKESLRQQLREAAAQKLEGLVEQMQEAAERVVADTSIDPSDLMSMVCKSQVNTLREKLITKMANETEAELMDWFRTKKPLGEVNDTPSD